MPRSHDKGGWPTDEPIDRSEHQAEEWERQIAALLSLLLEKGLLGGDEFRVGIESIPTERYESLSYYQRWAVSIERLMIDHSLMSSKEIDEKVRTMEGSSGRG